MLPDAPNQSPDDAERAMSDAESEAIGREFARILGPDADDSEPGQGTPTKFFWLLPLTSPAAFLAFLASVPSNAGAAGLEAAAARLAAEVLARGGAPPASDAAG